MFSSFLRCSVLWLMVCCRRWSKAVRCRAVPGKTRPRVSSTLGLHMAGWGKREFRRPRRCAIGGAVGKTTASGGTKVGNARAVRSRLRRGAGAAKRPAGRRGVGGKSAIGASKLSSERSKNDAKSDSYCSISGAWKVEPATTDRKFAPSGTSGSPYFGTCPPQTPTVANSTAPKLHMARSAPRPPALPTLRIRPRPKPAANTDNAKWDCLPVAGRRPSSPTLGGSAVDQLAAEIRPPGQI